MISEKRSLLLKEQAKLLALKEYKGIVKSIALSKIVTPPIYIVDILTLNGEEHKVKINAQTGRILKEKMIPLTKSRAKAYALRQHKGIIESIVLTNKQYEIVILGLDGKRHSVKIDAEIDVLAQEERTVQ
ncbi:PepSY domain-containing protein [Priestia megaterium]